MKRLTIINTYQYENVKILQKVNIANRGDIGDHYLNQVANEINDIARKVSERS